MTFAWLKKLVSYSVLDLETTTIASIKLSLPTFTWLRNTSSFKLNILFPFAYYVQYTLY